MPDTTSTSQRGGAWTTRRLLAWMGEAFTERGLDSPRLCAEMLLAHVLGCKRLSLYVDADRPATPIERETLRGLVSRALKHEPIQYLIGEGWFFGLPFSVDRRVLIPRPSSEGIVEHVLQHARVSPGFERGLIADVCTGSGCLGIAIARNLKGARVVLTDLSRDALEVAAHNADRHGVRERVSLLEGDLLDPLRAHNEVRASGGLHALIANPPYIPDHEWASVEANVKDHEPESALRGGEDGMRFVAALIEGGPELLRGGGQLLIEFAACTRDEVLRRARGHELLTDARVMDDLDGLPRVLVATRR
ncbi:MAG: peptide chain release factor N(5)-glutamine methyltransferase [Planctomycetota bacterium]